MDTAVDKCEMFRCYPEHVRKQIVEILKTGMVHKEWLTKEDILLYLEVSSVSPPLRAACEEKLLDNVNAKNCLDALEIAEAFGLLLLKKEAISLLVENFQELWVSESFQYLSENILENICHMHKIAKHNEVFRALERWLDWKHETRLKMYCKLLEIVQQQRTPQKFSCSKKSYTTYHAMLMSSAAKSKHTVVTAVFNCDGDVVCHRNLFKSTDIKEDFSVACVQKDETEAPYVYIASGKHVFRYDPMLNKHENCNPLYHTRTQSSLVSLDECVYAIGGHHNGNNVNEIEEMDTKNQKNRFMKKKWKVVAKTQDNIKLHSAPCVTYSGKIYTIGELLNDGQPSTTIIMFNPEDKSVKTVAEFPKKCSDCKAVLYGSNIYIASSEGYFLKFSIDTNIFTSCSDLPTKGRYFGMYTEGDMIYTVGGTSSDNNIGQFEKDEYDIQTNSWKRVRDLPCNLPIYGNCDIKVPSYTNVIPFYDTRKEIRR